MQKIQTMPTPKKKKKQKRAVKINPRTQFSDGTGLLEKDVKDYVEKSRSNFDGTLKPGGKGFVPPPLATGQINPDNNPAQLMMPYGKALKYLHQYKKSLSKPAFDLIKKKAKEGVLSYGLLSEILEQSAEFSFDEYMSSKDEEETPRKLYSGGLVRPIKRKR